MAHTMDAAALRQEILACIAAGKEGEWWDFKQEWHSSMKELVKDIVCFANTAHDRDCYLIIGVADDRRITGMKKPRRKQADILEALTHVPFAGEYVPLIEVVTFQIEGKDVDVLIIPDTAHTPFYLLANYGSMDKGCIYVRVGDKNTASHGNADIHDIERLWRKRFGLTKPPLDYLFDELHDPSLWVRGDAGYYHRLRPEYTLTLRRGSGPDSPLCLTQSSPTLMHEILCLAMGQTELSEYPILVLNQGTLRLPMPQTLPEEWAACPYYIRDSRQETLLRFLNPESSDALRRALEPILILDSEEEEKAFCEYLSGKRDEILAAYINEARYHTSEPRHLSDRLRIWLVYQSLLQKFRAAQGDK